jgi:inositol-phosphate phosphatase/L-galactose 1-phosphate phosphatase/histidinol-phosphatase
MTSDAQRLYADHDYLRFANHLADLARPLARSYFRTPLDVIAKDDASPVTIADREIERHLRQLIEVTYPDHGIFGEENGVKPGNTWTWVIDPIDGTKSFVSGMPLFGTLIALAESGKARYGVIDMPILAERWVGTLTTTHFNGTLAKTSNCQELGRARFYTTSPDMFRGDEVSQFERLSTAAGMRRFGGDCYIFGLLASGHVDLVLETGLQPYDYMALIPVIEGSGGCISDWKGGPLSITSSGQVLASASRRLHDAALTILNS